MSNKVQVGLELYEPHEGAMEKREWDGDEVKFVQLCVDASTWSMVTILGLGRIQVKRRLLGL